MDIIDATPIWLDNPQDHDYPAAANYLSLLLDSKQVDEVVTTLKAAKTVHYFAKDILRSSRLPLLPLTDPHVAIDLARVIKGTKLSPILMVRGDLNHDAPMTIADGYHRACAGYHLADNTAIPCRIVDLPGRHHTH